MSLADEQETFFQYVVLDSGPEVSAMLKKGISPNLTEPERGDTGLVLALRENSMEVFRVLLNAEGIELNHRIKNGDTALMIAAWKENVEAARALIAKGAFANQHGWTALHYAAAKGNSEIVQLLLDKRADINARSPTHITPMMMAARNGHIYTVKLLLDRGADASLTDMHGRSVVDWALAYSNTDIAEGMKRRLEKTRQRRKDEAEERIMKQQSDKNWLTTRMPPME